MYKRIDYINEDLMQEHLFLFGARQTGKSTYLKSNFPGAVYIDLLDSEVLRRFSKKPSLLYEMLHDVEKQTDVIIDEIPQVPLLLNEVHRLTDNKNLHFILCGSSARKLKRNGYNTLGGRAIPVYFYPFVSCEIPDFKIDVAVQRGMLPNIYTASNPMLRLSAYIDVYLKEEIKQEAIVRNLDSFQRFLEVAALTDGEMVNYNNIAGDCGVSAVTVKEYFSILEETLIGYIIPAYAKTIKRKLVQSPRFYYFDVGVSNYLLHREKLQRGTVEYGHAFEHFVIQELVAYIHVSRNINRLSYWRTYTGVEVDAIIGDAKLAIEIKSTEEVQHRHLKGLKSFKEEHADCRLIVVSLDRFSRTSEGVDLIYIYDFLKKLWAGELF